MEEKYWVFVVGWFSGVGLKVDFDDFGGSKKPVETFQSLFRTTKVLSPQLKKKNLQVGLLLVINGVITCYNML